MPAELAWLALGVLVAWAGGELFVRGAAALAAALAVPAGLIGSTVAAFATSSPELSVSVNAALEGAPQIALGDALGSNVVNIGLVLGLTLLLGPSQVTRTGVRADLPAALAVPLAVALLVADGEIGRLDAVLLLAGFAGWLAFAVRVALGEPVPVSVRPSPARAVGPLAAGLVLLIGAGYAIVIGAKGLAMRFGWDPFVVGATLVAVGTSTPELATSLVAKLRGHADIGLGTLLGSNVFNGAVIVPVAALIAPISVAPGEVAVALGAGALLVLAALPYRSATLGRARGVLLLAVYAAYLGALGFG
jgi:cation:H+ antiporter